MVKRRRRSDAFVNGVPVEAPSANSGNPLLELPEALIADIASRAVRLGAGGALSLTCIAFSRTNLLNAPALRLQLDCQRCDQLLTPRVVAALQFRTCELALIVEEQRDQHNRQYIRLLTKVRKKLASCAVVEACKLVTIQGPSLAPRQEPPRLICSPKLAQCVMDSFPSLTSLSLHNYTIRCSELASLLAHPQLSLQLQQLDLSSSTMTQANRPHPGTPITLDNMFHASRLKQLSLLVGREYDEWPNLQPLSQHLTQLSIQLQEGTWWSLCQVNAALQPLTQLHVLTISRTLSLEGLTRDGHGLEGLHGVLQALPQLHTLQLPDATVYGQEQLDTLLAATQLTSIQLHSVEGLTSSRADALCSWQRLELTGRVDYSSAAYLPLHSLIQPLVLGALVPGDDADCALVAAAVHNLTQACSVPLRIKELRLNLSDKDTAAEQRVKLQQLVVAS